VSAEKFDNCPRRGGARRTSSENHEPRTQIKQAPNLRFGEPAGTIGFDRKALKGSPRKIGFDGLRCRAISSGRSSVICIPFFHIKPTRIRRTLSRVIVMNS
jgi:hypothetical protein